MSDTPTAVDNRRVLPAAARDRFQQGALLIDVRRAVSRVENGVVPGSEHVEKADVAARFGDADRDQPVVVFCGSENGSRPVVEQLVELGFTDVSHIEGGYPAWREAGLPTEELPDR